MSLDFNFEAIEDRKTNFPDQQNGDFNVKLLSMVWLSIPVGIGEITQSNASEFWFRVELWQKTVGSAYSSVSADSRNPTPIFIDLVDVQQAIGLRTNASRHSRTEFINRLAEALGVKKGN